MTKKQKTWLWVFIAMFAVPEILWSPVANFYYQLSQTSQSGGTAPFRYNFLQNSDNLNYLRLVMFLQFLGLLLLLSSVVKNKLVKNRILRYFLITTLSILLIIIGFAFYFAMTFSIDIM